MSGGSYDYLCFADADKLLQNQDTVQRMIDRLSGLGYAKDAARESEELLLTLRMYETRITTMRDRLYSVWHAIEWWDSCDSGEEQVKEALERYRGDKK